ncbi:MAG: efflux RND transporter periplasmic adaptor subunit [Atopobiaceae bacterium]|jgi:HlyD family secretion protein|nr:efflux RND transporter periplasmic adaptor subunit [Atopobiaceae bacterium]MCI2172853.1 efflux RND transporter periplasmic adaptor subunit [Atopobiaceae bacterium]MCI2207160.1 efflux RND transporter periplasmic adaptor subunit [Atopobiaceae bacterium]
MAFDDNEGTGRADRLNDIPVIEPAEGEAPEGPTTLITPVRPTQGESADDGTDDVFRALEDHRRATRRKKLRRRIIVASVIGLVVIAVVVQGMLGAQAAGDSQTDVATAQVTMTDFVDAVSSSGTLEPVSSVVVAPQTDGTIDSVNVAQGDTVNKGDVLFTIKNDSLDAAVSTAEQQVKTAKNGVRQAQAALDDAKSAAQSAKQAAQAAAASGETTGETGGSATSTDSAEASLDGAKITLETAQQAYDQAVEAADKRTVYAPASGSVIAMNAVSGAALGSGSSTAATSSAPLVQIADLSQMKVTVQVNEVDIPKVTVGQAAKVSFSAVDGLTLDGTVTNIASTSSASASATAGASGTGGSGVVTYAVEVLIPQPDPRLKPGMTATAKITTQTLPGVLTVPIAALQTRDDGSTYLLVKPEDETQPAEERTVTVKAKSATIVALEGDVSDGATVVIPTATDTTASTSEA